MTASFILTDWLKLKCRLDSKSKPATAQGHISRIFDLTKKEEKNVKKCLNVKPKVLKPYQNLFSCQIWERKKRQKKEELQL